MTTTQNEMFAAPWAGAGQPLTETFEANGPDGLMATWTTDAETLALVRQYRDNEAMLGFLFHGGRAAGRIVPA